MESYLNSANTVLICLVLFVGMVLLLNLGNTIGKVLRTRHFKKLNEPINSTVLGSVFGLLAFLLAFTFGMGGTRYDTRRTNNINEANAIGTAMLRADLYPGELRQAFRNDFKEYIDARVAYFDAGPDAAGMTKADQKAQDYGAKIWSRAANAARNNTSLFPGNMMIPAVNDMLDAANYTNYGEKFRVPDAIVILLFALSLICAFFVGYYSEVKGIFNILISIGFCLLCSFVIYITLDLDHPRTGLIRHQVSLRAFKDLQKQIAQP